MGRWHMAGPLSVGERSLVVWGTADADAEGYTHDEHHVRYGAAGP